MLYHGSWSWLGFHTFDIERAVDDLKEMYEQKNNLTGAEFYRKIIDSLPLQEMECPYCGSKSRFKQHGTYSRYIVEWIKGRKVCSVLEVVRFRCESCGKTHTYLPSFIIPCSFYGLCFVLVVLMQYFKRELTIAQICEKYGISESMLYRWVHRFEKSYENWEKLIKSEKVQRKYRNREKILGKTENILEFIYCIIFSDVFWDNYLLIFRKSLMECGFEGKQENK